MYARVLALHSVVRWIVVVLGVVAAVRAVRGQSGRQRWTAADENVGLGFTIALDVQLLLGLALFLFLSPLTTLAVHDLGMAMKTRALRFWTVEHPLLMMAAVVLAHVGRVRTRRTEDSLLRHRAAAMFFGLAVLLVLAGMPWRFLPYGRPWLW
jgi:Na+-driven multidrug efflux pump